LRGPEEVVSVKRIGLSACLGSKVEQSFPCGWTQESVECIILSRDIPHRSHLLHVSNALDDRLLGIGCDNPLKFMIGREEFCFR